MKIISNQIDKIIDDSAETILSSKILSNEIVKAIDIIVKSIKNGNKIIIFGNGGSAADAQHIAAEFIGRYLKERKSLPALALTTDSSIITAIGNDYNFNQIFSRQAESLIKKGDVVIAISTSGNSKNVLNGMKTGKKNGATIISLTGKNGKKMKSLSDLFLAVQSKSTPRIQESHRTIIHIICEFVEKEFLEKK